MHAPGLSQSTPTRMVSDNRPPLPSPAPVVFAPFCLPVFPAISASPHPHIPASLCMKIPKLISVLIGVDVRGQGWHPVTRD